MISSATNPILPDSSDLARLIIVVSVVWVVALVAAVAITIRRRRANEQY